MSDQGLINALNQGSEAAYKEIYDRYWRSLFLVAKNRLNSQHDAEELVQNIFCTLWRRRFEFSLKGSLNAYFAVALKYEVINFLARKHKEKDYLFQLSNTSAADLSTEHQIRLREVMERIEASVTLLPERSQLIFNLRFEQGYAQKEIAAQLDISEKTVEAHISKLRKHIRAGLDPLTITLAGTLYLYLFL